jgi:hypothetical protein
MTGPDLEWQELARDLAAFAAKAMREATLLAAMAVRLTDETYLLPIAAGVIKRMTGGHGVGIMLADLLKPMAERARSLCDRDQMTAKTRRRAVQSAVDQGGVVFLSVRKPAPGANGDGDYPPAAA